MKKNVKKNSIETSMNKNLKKLTKKREPRKLVIRESDGTTNTIKTCDECANRAQCTRRHNNDRSRTVRCTEFA